MLKTNWYAVHTLSQSEAKVMTYIEKTKSERNMSDKISEIIIPTDIEVQKKQIMERMRSMFEKTYILTFDKSASIYKEEDTVVPRAELPKLLSGVKEIVSFLENSISR